jgi:hypothetical protein
VDSNSAHSAPVGLIGLAGVGKQSLNALRSIEIRREDGAEAVRFTSKPKAAELVLPSTPKPDAHDFSQR